MLKDNLIMLRRLNGFSQEKIAEIVGISRQAYSKWENGETIPDIEKCSLLAEAYGVSIDSLIRTEQFDNKTIAPTPKGKHIFGCVTLSERGQIVIPKEARDLFSLSAGDRLVLLGDENQGLALVKETNFMENMNNIISIIKK